MYMSEDTSNFRIKTAQVHEENKDQCIATCKKTPTLHQNCTQLLLYSPECNRKLLPRIQCQNMWGHPELA